MLYKFLLFLLLLITSTLTYAQVVVEPLRFDPQRAQYSQSQNSFRIAASDTLQSLPFFDDFANYRGTPASSKWETTGGVYINNSYGVNPPSYNVATFDGLNSDGHSYNQTDPTAEGNADKLTSLPINLNKYSPADSLYLSFYWQAAGIGEHPDPDENNFLRLEFKDSNNIWNMIWEVEEDSTPFQQVILPVTEEKFFFEGFQFRFRSYGNLGGSNDIYNLDYILFSDNRSKADTNHLDLAIITSPGSFLKRYTAIPYQQFFPYWEKEVKDSIQFRIRNHSNDPIPLLMTNNSDSVNLVTDAFTKDIIDSFSVYTFAIAKSDTIVKWQPPYQKIAELNKPLNVKYHITPYVTDSILFSPNNQIADSTVIGNYYAYDDFSAEAAFHHNNSGGAMAVKYELNQSDSIVAVDINLIPYGNNALDKKLEIAVWSSVDIGKTTEALIHKKEVRVKYEKNNGFTRYYFDEPVAVTDSFYVGFIQYTNQNVTVGLDLSTDNSDKIVYNFMGSWYDYNATQVIKGSLMIHPVMGGDHYDPITAIKEPEKEIPRKVEFNPDVYPNPTKGTVKIRGNVNKVTVYDLSGMILYEKNFELTDQNKEITIHNAKPGIYLLRLEGMDGYDIRKIVLIN